MKPIYSLAALTLALSMTTAVQAQNTFTNSTIQPGGAILAGLASQNNNAAALQTGDILSDSQNAAGYQLTGELLLQLATQADFAALAARYNLKLVHAFGDIRIVTTPVVNLKQLLAQLATEPSVLKAGYDLRELGLSPDPEVINRPSN